MNSVLGPGVILHGKYRVESMLGQGAGVAPEGTHLHLGKKLAIEALLPEGAIRSETVFLCWPSAMVTMKCVDAISRIEVTHG